MKKNKGEDWIFLSRKTEENSAGEEIFLACARACVYKARNDSASGAGKRRIRRGGGGLCGSRKQERRAAAFSFPLPSPLPRRRLAVGVGGGGASATAAEAAKRWRELLEEE